MEINKLGEKIISLELSLLDKNIRNNENELVKIISKDFIEYGSSGNIYTYNETIKNMLEENDQIKFKIIKMDTKILSENIILVLYIIEMEKDGKKKVSNRSSIWINDKNNWKIIFHQGTLVNKQME